MWKIVKRGLFLILVAGVSMFLFIVVYFYTSPRLGGSIDSNRAIEYEQSNNYQNGKFINTVETTMSNPPFSAMWDVLAGVPNAEPNGQIETDVFDQSKYIKNSNDSTTKITWFGHSSVLVQIDGQNILLDPVFSKRASMFTFMGPERYDYRYHITVEDLPKIDAVLISHDHYDHLDYETFIQLKTKVARFYVPLGVGVHLEEWGIPKNQITELDWWEEAKFKGIALTLTPTRHFSGRGINDRYSTLWGAWAIKGNGSNLFFGGDSGYFDGFKKIGEQLGPFDFAMLECGQYSQYWPNIHMMPEETAQAGDDLKASHVMPIHWGKYTLSIHSWIEPVERFTEASKGYEYNAIVPELNKTFTLNGTNYISDWWRE